MNIAEIKLLRLSNQHLLNKTDAQTVARDLCGLQAQYLSHALHGLALRSEADTSRMVKSWTLRGTMHLFSEDDLPLFLHTGRQPFLRPQDTLDADEWMRAHRKEYFAEVILDSLASGSASREALKLLCRSKGLTEAEESSLFDPWGGIIRALCENGRICHLVCQDKAYRLCPEFSPMDADSAHLELVRRYFTHFGPATVKDAAYFLGWTQKEVNRQLDRLDVDSFALQNRSFFHIPTTEPQAEMPHCLFLAGFDQLMLGYEKKESLFLAPDHLRQIFTLSGIIRPALLVDGTVAGYWNLKNNRLTITSFHPLQEVSIREAAATQWTNLKHIVFA